MASRFSVLEHADILRDGGSYEAQVLDEVGNRLRIRLAIDSDPTPPGILRHRGLYLERLSEPSASGEDVVERRSARERELLSGLLLLASSLEASSDQLDDEAHGALERLYELLAYAKTRRG